MSRTKRRYKLFNQKGKYDDGGRETPDLQSIKEIVEDPDNAYDRKKAPGRKKLHSQWHYKPGTMNWNYITRVLDKNIGKSWDELYSKLVKDLSQYEQERLSWWVQSHILDNDSEGNKTGYGKWWYRRGPWLYIDSKHILRKGSNSETSGHYRYRCPKTVVLPIAIEGSPLKVQSNCYLVYNGSEERYHSRSYYLVDTFPINPQMSMVDFDTLMKHTGGDVMTNKRFGDGYKTLPRDLFNMYGEFVFGYRYKGINKEDALRLYKEHNDKLSK